MKKQKISHFSGLNVWIVLYKCVSLPPKPMGTTEMYLQKSLQIHFTLANTILNF